jgi:PAS domain S-box-containing protein
MAQPLTVLIVDDCPEDRQVYRRYLLQDQEHSYTILEEESGEGALTLCEQFQPDAILLDFLLPDLDGLEFLAELKQQLKTAMPAVIMLTGYGNEALAVQAMKSGVQDYLVKGQTSGKHLRSTLHSAIRNTQLSQELQRSEERFRTSVENMLDCFGIFSSVRDHTGQILHFRVDYMNAAACEFCQMGYEELQGKYLCNVLPNLHESGLFNQCCQVVETSQPVVKESLIYTALNSQQQSARAIDIRITKMEDGFVASWRDVTAKKRAEAELYKSENKFRRIVESNIVGVYFGNFSGQIYEANDAFLDMFGYSRAELEAGNIHWDGMTPPEYYDLDQQKIQELQISGVCTPFEKEYFRRNGTRVPILLGIALIDGRQEDGYSVCFVLDLTQRKCAEMALRQSEERYRYLSNVIPQLVWICNTQGECEHVNQQWDELTGQTVEETKGFGWTKVIHPDELPSVMQEWTQALSAGKTYTQEIRYQKRDGSYCWHLVRSVPIKDEQGEIIKWFGTGTDINDRKQLEAERDRLLQLEQIARATAEKANQTKDEFVAMVSHDLRSPLNAILGWAQMLRTRQLDPDTINVALETIERNAQSQAKLLEDLLNMSRILRGKLQLELTSVNLVSLVKAAVETAYPSANAQNIQLESVIDECIPPIMGDINRLLQVLGNLLANAIKFTPSGGRVTICLSSINVPENPLTTNKYAQITVSDTGIGISPEFLPYIFERYHQADCTYRQGGLGLGLAIARHLVELHGGTIHAASKGEQQGSTFTIKLPLHII